MRAIYAFYASNPVTIKEIASRIHSGDDPLDRAKIALDYASRSSHRLLDCGLVYDGWAMDLFHQLSNIADSDDNIFRSSDVVYFEEMSTSQQIQPHGSQDIDSNSDRSLILQLHGTEETVPFEQLIQRLRQWLFAQLVSGCGNTDATLISWTCICARVIQAATQTDGSFLITELPIGPSVDFDSVLLK